MTNDWRRQRGLCLVNGRHTAGSDYERECPLLRQRRAEEAAAGERTDEEAQDRRPDHPADGPARPRLRRPVRPVPQEAHDTRSMPGCFRAVTTHRTVA